MKSQHKRVTTTTSTTSSSVGNAQQQIGGQQTTNDKSNFSKAVALLVAQKQRKAGVLSSHKNSLPDSTMNLSQEQINHLNHLPVTNSSTSASNSNPLSSKLNQSINKTTNQPFHLPSANIQNLSQQPQGQQNYQQHNQAWNLSNSLNKSNILDTSYGNYTNQPAYSLSTQNQQSQQQQAQSFSGQKYPLKPNYIGGSINSQTGNGGNTFQQTRPSQAQQKLNQLLEQSKGGRSSPSRIAQTEQSILTINSSFHANQNQHFNNSFQAQSQFNQVYTQHHNPSSTLPVYQNQKSNNNAHNLNTSNNHQQVSHTLQDASPIRKTRQSLELRTRPLHTEGNASSSGQNAGVQYNLLMTQPDQIFQGNHNSNQLASQAPPQPPHYMLSKPNQKPYAARIYKQNKTTILSKNDILNTSKDRPLSSQQNGNQILQTSLIESNRNNSYLTGSGSKQKPQQYFQLNSFNNNTQPASRAGNLAISPVGINRSDNQNKNDSQSKGDNYNKGHSITNGFYNNNTISSLQSNYHPLNTFMNTTQNVNNTTCGSAAQVFIQQVKDKINLNRHKGKQSNSIGGNSSQNNSQALQNSHQQSSFIHHGPSMSGVLDIINSSGINNSINITQNPNSVKAAQYPQQLQNNSNLINSGGIPPQPQYHHQKNSKSMTINKNSFINNFNMQSPIGNTTQINLNTSKESTDYSFLNSNLMPLQTQISQSPSIHSIQKKAKLQMNNLNTSINSSQHQQQQQQQQQQLLQQQQQQNNLQQQFLQQQRAQTQSSSRREQDTQKSNVSNPNRATLNLLQHSSASQLIDDQTNLSNITTNFITINEKSSPKIYSKVQQDSFRYYDEALEDFMQKNRFTNENKLDYFDNFLMTLNDIQRRSQVNQKLNFSQQQQQQYQQMQNVHLQHQQHLNIVSASHNTAASLFQNSSHNGGSNKFFENLKQILESPIQGLLQESRQQKLEFEQKISQTSRELDLERKERAVLEMKIDILEQEKDKLQNLVTTLSKQQQVNSQKSRNISTNSHTNSHNTSHNNTSNFINANTQQNHGVGSNLNQSNNTVGFNLTQQEIQMLLAENEKLKNIGKKQRKQMSTNRQKEEKLMKLLYAIRKHGINVDEIYNDNVKTPDSLSPSAEQNNRFQQKAIDFISPEHNHLSQFQPWELSQDHNISQNTAKVNSHQAGQQGSANQNKHQMQPSQQNQQKHLKKETTQMGKKGDKINKKQKQNPFYVNSQHEDDDCEDNNQIGEDEEYENDLYEDDQNNDIEYDDVDQDNDDDDDNDQNNDNHLQSNPNFKQFTQNNHEISWQGGDCAATHQLNFLTSPNPISKENQHNMKFQKSHIRMNEDVQQNVNNEILIKDKQNYHKGRYSNQNDDSQDQMEEYYHQNEKNQYQQQYPHNNLQQNINNFIKIQEQNKYLKNTNINETNNYNNVQSQDNNLKSQYNMNNNSFKKEKLSQDFNQDCQMYIQDGHFGRREGSPQQNVQGEGYIYENNQNNKQRMNNPTNDNGNQFNYQNNSNEEKGGRYNEQDQINSEKSVTDSESDVLSIPVNDIAYASQSNKMINPLMKNKLKINLGCLQVKDPANNNMHLNLGKQQNGEGQNEQFNHEEIFGYHDEFMNKFDEFSQSWRDAINQEKKRYQNDTAPISHIYVSAL